MLTYLLSRTVSKLSHSGLLVVFSLSTVPLFNALIRDDSLNLRVQKNGIKKQQTSLHRMVLQKKLSCRIETVRLLCGSVLTKV